MSEVWIELNGRRDCYVSLLVGPIRFPLEGKFDRPGVLWLMQNCGLVCHMGPGVSTWLGIPDR